MSVRRLLASLERQRSCFGLERDLTDVLKIVQHLNLACRTGAGGPNHYFSSNYVRYLCLLIPRWLSVHTLHCIKPSRPQLNLLVLSTSSRVTYDGVGLA
jgi:hypothetical protein